MNLDYLIEAIIKALAVVGTLFCVSYVYNKMKVSVVWFICVTVTILIISIYLLLSG